jgi:hypothetical protein
MLSLSLETEEHIFIINYPLAELGVGTAIETLWYSGGIFVYKWGIHGRFETT